MYWKVNLDYNKNLLTNPVTKFILNCQTTDFVFSELNL
jgi:hypothetical protein